MHRNRSYPSSVSVSHPTQFPENCSLINIQNVIVKYYQLFKCVALLCSCSAVNQELDEEENSGKCILH